MHPLVKQAAIEASRGLWARVVERLAKELPLLEGEALRDAVRELLVLAALMEEHGDDAGPIFALLESPEIIRALDRANASRVALQGDRSRHAAASLRGPEIARASPDVRTIRMDELGARRFAGLKLR